MFSSNKDPMSCAGELTAVVTDPHGSLLNVRVDRTVDCNRQTIEFTPRIEGTPNSTFIRTLCFVS